MTSVGRRRQALLMFCSSVAALLPSPATAQPSSLLPFLQVERNSAHGKSLDSPVGGYVRFWIARVQIKDPSSADRKCARGEYQDRGGGRELGKEKGTPLGRIFWGRSYSRVLQAKLTVNRSSVVSQSVTLASSHHDSTSHEGESWQTDLGEKRFLTPYFRVDQGATATLDVSLLASREPSSNIARGILSIIQAGANLAAPKSPLVTSLNSERISQTTDFIDKSITKLFSEKDAETNQTELPPERWRFDTQGSQVDEEYSCEVGSAAAAIVARFPMGSHIWSGNDLALGEWRVYTTPPIVSIFSNVQLYGPEPTGRSPVAWTRCRGGFDTLPSNHLESDPGKPGKPTKPSKPTKPKVVEDDKGLTDGDLRACVAFHGLVPTRVLGLLVDDKTTLGQALRGDAGIAAALQQFQGTGASGDVGKAHAAKGREVCNLVAEKADGLGFNAWDVAATVWAFAWNGGLDEHLAEDIWQSQCLPAKLAQRLGLTDVPSSAAATPASEPPASNGAGSGVTIPAVPNPHAG